MFRFLIILFLFLSLCSKSQFLLKKEQHIVNNHLTRTFVKKQNLIFVKTTHFKFTLKTNLNNKALLANDKLNCVAYDFRTKYYLSKKVQVILRTQIKGATTITSLGLSYYFNRK